MTGYCDEILTRTGNMNVYEETFESIGQKVKDMEVKEARSNPKIVKEDDLDMYADDFDTKEQEKLVSGEPSTSKDQAGSSNQDTEQESGKDDIQMWEYKISLTDEKIHGPFNSEQMQKFVDEGKFKEPVFVRKIEKGSDDKQFYTSSRIDFELYI
uniref:CSON005708 protein n=1 Tax=Culicoides sonorensis TaxID=179676 RepID=A0A336MRW1_CULSO